MKKINILLLACCAIVLIGCLSENNTSREIGPMDKMDHSMMRMDGNINTMNGSTMDMSDGKTENGMNMDHSMVDMGDNMNDGMEKMDHSAHMKDGNHMLMGHTHDPIDVSDLENPPTLNLVGHIDQVSGVNIELQVENFVFSGASVNTRHEDGVGHAHVYLDGEKIARIYSNWYHIDGKNFTPGSHTIRVELNSNEHSSLLLDGEPIEDSIEVIIE